MRVISSQEGDRRKFDRPARPPGLERHAHGHGAHVDGISPGGLSCFANVGMWPVRLGRDAGRPASRKPRLSMQPDIAEPGVRHLDLCQGHHLMLDDGGLGKTGGGVSP